MRMIDLTGRRFNRLLVIDRASSVGERRVKWNCLCNCGTIKAVISDNLLKGTSGSCGCLKVELTKINNATHGKSDSREFMIWSRMKGRCINPRVTAFPFYGGRGITVCPRWLNSFEAFFDDMGLSQGLTLDRIDTNGNYEPTNCRWATQREQTRNKRNNVRATVENVTLTAVEWVERTRISDWKIREAIRKNVLGDLIQRENASISL